MRQGFRIGLSVRSYASWCYQEELRIRVTNFQDDKKSKTLSSVSRPIPPVLRVHQRLIQVFFENRFVWVRRASLYHASRLRLNSFYRKRTVLDDQLLADMCELSLSMYVQVRRFAQKALDSMTHYFDGARSILFDRLFDALKRSLIPCGAS